MNGPPDDGRGNDDQTLRDAATSNDPAVGLTLGGRAERSADALSSPLSTASATTMPPDVTQFPDWFQGEQLTSTAITSSPISHSVGSFNHMSTLSTSELQLRSD